MNDERLTEALRSLYRDTAAAVRDPEAGRDAVMTRVRTTRQRSRWWPLPSFGHPARPGPLNDPSSGGGHTPMPSTDGYRSSVTWRTRTMFSPVRVVMTTALIAALGGTWLIMQPREQHAGTVPGAAAPSAQAAEPTVTRTSDAVGDSGGGPDIVAVTTTATDEEVVVEVELADDADLSAMRLAGFLETGGGPRVSALGGKEALLPDPTSCNGWFSEATLEVTERPEMAMFGSSGAVLMYNADVGAGEALEYALDGRMLTLAIPLSLLHDPDMLSLSLRTWDAGSDEVKDVFPDEEQTCHLAFLKPSACGTVTECTEDQIAAAAMTSPASTPDPTEVIHVVGDDFDPYLSRRYTTELVGGVDQLRGGVVSMRSEMDDPRVSGETTYAFSIDAVDGAGSQWGTMRVENAEGAWEGPCTGGTWDDGASAIGGCWLTGSGAYEGYTYYRQHYWAEAIGSGVHGLIYPSLEGLGSLVPTDFEPLPSSE